MGWRLNDHTERLFLSLHHDLNTRAERVLKVLAGDVREYPESLTAYRARRAQDPKAESPQPKGWSDVHESRWWSDLGSADIAILSKCQTSQVEKTLKELVRLGKIRVEPHDDESGGERRNGKRIKRRIVDVTKGAWTLDAYARAIEKHLAGRTLPPVELPTGDVLTPNTPWDAVIALVRLIQATNTMTYGTGTWRQEFDNATIAPTAPRWQQTSTEVDPWFGNRAWWWPTAMEIVDRLPDVVAAYIGEPLPAVDVPALPIAEDRFKVLVPATAVDLLGARLSSATARPGAEPHVVINTRAIVAVPQDGASSNVVSLQDHRGRDGAGLPDLDDDEWDDALERGAS